MISDNERREVARNLESLSNGFPTNVHDNDDFVAMLLDVIAPDMGYIVDYKEVFSRLSELIKPE